MNEGQIKLVAAIILHADIKDRTNNAFPHNRTLAFYCGFGRIIEGTKAYKEYSNLNNDDKAIYLKKKEKNAIQTVKNIKKSLEEIGVLTREVVGSVGKQVTYMTLDLNWKKEEYLKDFNNYFNKNSKKDSEGQELESLLNNIVNMNKNGTSKESMLDMVNKLKEKLEPTDMLNEHDVSVLATYIMETPKIKAKINKNEITKPENYKKELIKRIKNNSYEGLDKTIKELYKHEEKILCKTIHESLNFDKPTIINKDCTYELDNIKINDALIDVTYKKDKDQTVYKLSNENLIKYTKLIKDKLSTKSMQFISSYEENISKYKKENSHEQQ